MTVNGWTVFALVLVVLFLLGQIRIRGLMILLFLHRADRSGAAGTGAV